MGKRDGLQVKPKPKTYNNFVSPGAKFEFGTDIMDTESKDAPSNTRYGLAAIESFTNIAEVVPIKNRTPEAMMDGKEDIYPSGKTKTAIFS